MPLEGRSHGQCHHSTERIRFLFNFNRNYAPNLCHFRDIASYVSKFADSNLPDLHLTPSLGVTRAEFRGDLRRWKTIQSLSYSDVNSRYVDR